MTIVYFGGSITVGEATYPLCGENRDSLPYDYTYDLNRDSWRALTFDWLKRTLEKKPGQFLQVNAAYGGTGSIVGAFRLNEHVLACQPDFVFIEFAVNDNGIGVLARKSPSADLSIYRTYLSIAAKLREQNPEIALFAPISTYRRHAALGGEQLWGDIITEQQQLGR